MRVGNESETRSFFFPENLFRESFGTPSSFSRGALRGLDVRVQERAPLIEVPGGGRVAHHPVKRGGGRDVNAGLPAELHVELELQSARVAGVERALLDDARKLRKHVLLRDTRGEKASAASALYRSARLLSQTFASKKSFCASMSAEENL